MSVTVSLLLGACVLAIAWVIVTPRIKLRLSVEFALGLIALGLAVVAIAFWEGDTSIILAWVPWALISSGGLLLALSAAAQKRDSERRFEKAGQR